MPALIENRPVQPGFLAHLASGFGNGAFSAGRHAFGVEVFKNHVSEPHGKIKACSVVPILADTGASGAQCCNATSGIGVTLAAPFSTAQHPLGASLTALNISKTGRKRKPLTRGQRQRIRHAPINTDRGRNVRRGVMLNCKAKTDMPAVRRKANRGVVDLADKWASVAVSHPADFRQAHLRPFGIQLAGLNFTPLKAKTVIAPPLSRTGVSGIALKPVLVSPVEIAQCLLLASLGDGSNPVVFCAECRQFAGLGNVGNVLAIGAVKLPPVFPSLFKAEVVDQAAYSGKLVEQFFLRIGRMQFVPIATLDHSPIIPFGLIGDNMDYRTGRHVVYMLHVHLVFITKYRRDVLSELAIRDLKRIFANVCVDFEAELIECDGEDDHVHLLVHYPPKIALSKLVNSLKGVSSRLLREHRPEITGRYHKSVLWSPSYFAASCGGAPLSVVAEYVKSQREAAKGRSRIPPRPEGRGIQRGKR